MPTVTLSSKHQITLPMEVVRTLGLKPGDKLVAELIDDHVVLLPQPASWVDYFSGSTKGVYGSTVEEIDRYIDDLRGGRERDEWHRRVRDLIERDDDVREVVERLREFPRYKATRTQLQAVVSEPERVKIPPPTCPHNQKLWVALWMLKEEGAVREVPRAGQESIFYVVREFAHD